MRMMYSNYKQTTESCKKCSGSPVGFPDSCHYPEAHDDLDSDTHHDLPFPLVTAHNHFTMHQSSYNQVSNQAIIISHTVGL